MIPTQSYLFLAGKAAVSGDSWAARLGLLAKLLGPSIMYMSKDVLNPMLKVP